MEMHQVRYFLGVARTLNFTRAAEECNVSQPSLTRAIKQLEGEFGGDLFRRERPQAILTELGERMLPLLNQCYESALSARELALSIKKGEVAALGLALSHTFDINLLLPHLNELRGRFDRLDCRLLRGTGPEVLGYLKNGDAELAIGSDLGEGWDRLDAWPLFSEGFVLLVNSRHRLAGQPSVDLQDLRQERLLLRTYCEQAEQCAALLREHGLDVEHCYQITSEGDLLSMLGSDLGVAFVPRSASGAGDLVHVPVNGFDLSRSVYLYGVAGRQRSTVAATMMKMVRAANWSRYADAA
ncbi:MAG: LysR family transcriptional regulator [Xanthobacteraceae bacterium]|nr:LysR family transcriptional regulator [Xanthobacteraceae bacterium]